MLYQNYGKGFEVADELPLFIVINLIENALKKETESKLYSLWLAHYQVSILNGAEPKSFESMLEEVYQNENITTKSKEEILKTFAPIVERDKQKRGGN